MPPVHSGLGSKLSFSYASCTELTGGKALDYPYENLSPERFQQFCQALISKDYPNFQSFPVGQPDGGRDGVQYHLDKASRTFTVFQVKFIRQPIDNPRHWLLSTLKEELPKIQNQVTEGATHYILLTNARGTAHPKTGAIDLTHDLMAQGLPIPAQCWWRDDLNRRLDNAWDLKWSYPELMTGPDLIRFALEKGFSEGAERRLQAIKAFVKDQFLLDEEVKFKQLDLQNNLLDLFIDVPVSPPSGAFSRKKQGQLLWIHHQIARERLSRTTSAPDTDNQTSTGPYSNREERSVGGATFLLHPLAQSRISRCVLEGAPGQGKSTITQYVCQVHRMRVLNKHALTETLPKHYISCPLRLPFRIDLRDLATWLSKKNPFSTDEADLPIYWKPSLEAFLAAQVQHHSGGIEFSPSDLLAMAKYTALLIAFDGLDEVADISIRQQVVDEIVSGVERLEENAISLQVVVTSRPAAFANSPGLPEGKFPYYQLDALTPSLVHEFSEKWIRARRLAGRDIANLKKILKNKLDQPHLRDLARNPMQLTILLSLIHTRGSSLPDKRTSLYDNYVELFFNREAEKSPTVREHRDLLISIHRYLAWNLHVASEQGASSGSIKEEDLRILLCDYLEAEGHSPDLVDILFTGMIERVVAIVSRVEGTFEFEVQPLREYFAARYLYDTAPYSPPGDEKKGTKPDRFDTIARNFYWQNVTRFYAGCYSKGELASLIDRLQELINEDGYRLLSYPRLLAATLLGDWVFSQHPKSVKEVVKLILDGIGLRYTLNSGARRASSGNSLALPKQCGREEIFEHCMGTLKTFPPIDYSLDLIDLLVANSDQEQLSTTWLHYARLLAQSDDRYKRDQWLWYGLRMGALSRITKSDLQIAVTTSTKSLDVLFKGWRFDLLEQDKDMFSISLRAVLQRDIHFERQRRAQTVLDFLGQALEPWRYILAFRAPRKGPLRYFWHNETQVPAAELDSKNVQAVPPFAEATTCLEVGEVALSLAHRSTQEWATSIEPWDALVETIRSNWGDTWATYHFANLAAGIRSHSETCRGYNKLSDRDAPLCRRARYARLRAGHAQWWKREWEKINSLEDAMFFNLLLISWASVTSLTHLMPQINSFIEGLSYPEWARLLRSLRDAVSSFDREERGRSSSMDWANTPGVGPRLTTLLLLRLGRISRRLAYESYLQDYRGDDPLILRECQQIVLNSVFHGKTNWAAALPIISRTYKSGIESERYSIPMFLRRTRKLSLPLDIATEILTKADQFPGFLIASAEHSLQGIIARQIEPVGVVVEREGWVFA